MWPVVAAGAAAGARALPALLTAARTAATGMFSSTPAVVAKAATRTGIAGGATKVLSAMKNNKLVTALVLMEMGTEGAALLTEMSAADAEIAELIKRYGWAPDPVSTTAMIDLNDQREELAAINDAARACGGLDNLHAIRRALSLTDAHYKLYDQVRSLGRTVN